MQSVRFMLMLFRLGIELMTWGLGDYSVIYFTTCPKEHFYQ